MNLLGLFLQNKAATVLFILHISCRSERSWTLSWGERGASWGDSERFELFQLQHSHWAHELLFPDPDCVGGRVSRHWGWPHQTQQALRVAQGLHCTLCIYRGNSSATFQIQDPVMDRSFGGKMGQVYLPWRFLWNSAWPSFGARCFHQSSRGESVGGRF